MRKSRRFGAFAAACSLWFASTLMFAGSAHAADGNPCEKPAFRPTDGDGTWAQWCPDWAPDNWIPVHETTEQGSRTVGRIYAPGLDWYVGQTQGGVYTLGAHQNNWWAFTRADNGEWGWVSEVYFAGGGNFEHDMGLWIYFVGYP